MTATPTAPSTTAGVPVATPKTSAGWTGFVMILGALVAAVGAFLPWEKLDIFDDGGELVGSIKVTALTLSVDGDINRDALTVGSTGKTMLGAAVIVLVAGVLIALRKGKLWVGIVGLLFSLSAMGAAVASFGAAENDGKSLLDQLDEGFSITAGREIGVFVSAVGGGIAVIGAILALVRRRAT